MIQKQNISNKLFKIFTTLLKNSGFSLPEVMIGVGISGLVTFAAYKILSQAQKTILTSQSSTNINFIFENIEKNLNDPKVCNDTLVNTPTIMNTDIRVLKKWINGTPNIIYKSSTVPNDFPYYNNKIRIDYMKPKVDNSVGNNGRTYIEVKISQYRPIANNRNNVISKTKDIDVPFIFTGTPGSELITSCQDNDISLLQATANASICTMYNGNYDQVQGKCSNMYITQDKVLFNIPSQSTTLDDYIIYTTDQSIRTKFGLPVNATPSP